MVKTPFYRRPLKDMLISVVPSALLIGTLLFLAFHYLDPEPPKHLVIGTGETDGDYEYFAKQYQDILKSEGINLELRPTEGPLENLRLLQDEESDVDVGFVQDGLGSPEDQPDIQSLGSVYYEPIWIFYRGSGTLTRL